MGINMNIRQLNEVLKQYLKEEFNVELYDEAVRFEKAIKEVTGYQWRDKIYVYMYNNKAIYACVHPSLDLDVDKLYKVFGKHKYECDIVHYENHEYYSENRDEFMRV